MTLILKIERALELVKELGLNDGQTKDLMALILELPNIKFNSPWTLPNVPQWPNGDTIITYGTAAPKKEHFINWNCACSPIGSPHSDGCKSRDSLIKTHDLHDH